MASLDTESIANLEKRRDIGRRPAFNVRYRVATQTGRSSEVALIHVAGSSNHSDPVSNLRGRDGHFFTLCTVSNDCKRGYYKNLYNEERLLRFGALGTLV
jgi:hypothetical protein